MSCHTLSSKNHDRHGMTLFELLVALAILIVLLGMTYPSLRQLVQDNQLVSASENLRSALVQARVRAIENGVTYEFRFEPFGQRFVILPADSGLAQAGTESAPTGATPTTSNEFWKVSGLLPEQLHLQAEGGGNVDSQTLPGDFFIGLDDAAELGQVSWSSPLQFLPDGSTTDEVIEVFDTDREYFIGLQIRGLTGAVALSTVQRGRP